MPGDEAPISGGDEIEFDGVGAAFDGEGVRLEGVFREKSGALRWAMIRGCDGL